MCLDEIGWTRREHDPLENCLRQAVGRDQARPCFDSAREAKSIAGHLRQNPGIYWAAFPPPANRRTPSTRLASDITSEIRSGLPKDKPSKLLARDRAT